jgi:DNA-binding SARP family transcriptional activator
MLVAVRVHLAGRICLDLGDHVLDEGMLAGSQGRLLFVMLVADRRRAVSKDELAEELWGDRLPSTWEQALRSLISKTRSVLAQVGHGHDVPLSQGLGCYQLSLPPGTWVDLEAAADATHRADAALRGGQPSRVLGCTQVALTIARRPLLPGHEGAWVSHRRHALESIRLRALDSKVQALMKLRDPLLALSYAEEAVQVAPFSERSHRLVMRSHMAAGNRAEALRSYERLRSMLADELGVPPAPESQSLYQDVLA